MDYSYLNEPFAAAFLSQPEKSVSERIAIGMLAEAPHFPVVFPEKAMLPSVGCEIPDCFIVHTWRNGIEFNEEKFMKKLEANPAWRDDLFALRDAMLPYCYGEVCNNTLSATYHRFCEAEACWGGTWIGHGNPDFGILLRKGTNGVRAYIEECRSKNPGKDGFYDACKTAMDALDLIAARIREVALQQASNTADEAKKAEYERMADVFTRVPMNPPADFYEATMSFWAAFSVQDADSPGNLDQYMYSWFEKSPYEECAALVKRMIEGFQYHRSWNLCISGSDEAWNDKTNELSYLILKIVTESGYNTPNLTMRVHRNTPEKLWDMAVTCIATGTGLPAIYNDEVVCKAFEKIGIPPVHSHLYCMNGCNQIDILGKSHMGLEDGEVNLGKVLELMMHGGCHMGEYREKLMEPLGDVFACRTFEEFLALYLKYQDFVSDMAMEAANTCAAVYARVAPHPLRSCLFEGCLERGRDYKNGGPLYGHGQILLEGIADTADSLYAVKKLVFDEKKYTLRQMVDALADDFVHWEDLRRDCKAAPKFGNDIPEVDDLCAYIVDCFTKHCKTVQTFRGGTFAGGCSTFSRAARYGQATGALPNGKHRGESNYADSIAATPGCDTNGPTASVNSCLHYDQTEMTSGFVTQMKFTKDVFNTEKGRTAFKMLAKTYFRNGGQQLSINVVDKELLLKAQKNPEQYRSLVVRVGGFSAYFCDLSEGLQQNVIDRTAFAM